MAPTPDDNRRWQAVQARDADSDGRFVYAVRSTGVYCRPSCPSPRPARQQVLFFAVPELAERAGFRPCRRCRPEAQPAADPGLDRVRRACRLIEGHLEEPLTLADLGDALNVSPHHFQRVFKKITGITPRQYADACRLGRLKAHLRDGEANVTTALYAAGYGSSSRLYERAAAQLGMTPATYRRGAPAVRIGYTIVDSPLGRLLLAATDRGVSRISLDDADRVLEDDLRKEFPAAEIRRDDAALAAWVGEVLRHLRGEQPHLDLPLDVRATAFQWKVWQLLRAIPRGSTKTYAEVARELGQPTAARAVARACATNPVSLVVPCHRVVREDGGLGGYRWGLDRKRKLLAGEQPAPPGDGAAAGPEAAGGPTG